MPTINKIRLPSGNEYDIEDTYARGLIAGGVSFEIIWTATDYASTSAPSSSKLGQIPENVIVYYNNGASSATGTLVASTDTKGKFYLIYSKTQSGTLDIFDEYATIESGTTYFWEKIGDTQIDLSNVVTGVSIQNNDTPSVVTGVSISVSGGTTDEVYGTGTTFALTNGAVTFGNPSKETFITSVSAETGKNLVTTSIVPTNGTESVSKVTKTASKLVTTSITPTDGTESVSKVTQTSSKLVTTSITPTDGTESVSKVTQTNSKLVTTSVPNVTSTGSADTWSFTLGTGNDAKTLIIGGGNGTAPTLGTAITVATGSVASGASGAAVVTSVSIADKTVAKAAASAVTVATGSTAANASGTAIVTGVTIVDHNVAKVASSAVTVATGAASAGASGADIVTGVTIVDHDVAKVGTAVTVATGSTSTTGSGSAIVTGVTIGSSADAITALPTATVGTGITVGTGDKVTVVKTIGTISANVNTSSVLGANTSLAVTKGGI